MENPRRFYTYAYLREDGTPYYIGKGSSDRIHSPNRRIKLPPKPRRLFLKQNLTEEEAFRHEIYMISVFGRKDLGTGILINMTNGGEGSSGFVASESIRKEMSRSRKGRKLSVEHKRKISESNMGRKYTEETKRKISESAKGKKLSKEIVEKLRRINIGNQYRKGYKTSTETKLKIKESLSTDWKITFEDGRVIEGRFSIRELCKKYGYCRKSIYKVMKKNQKKHKDIVSVEKLAQTLPAGAPDAL